ncbi:MAG: S-methyl-5-thioribose-1-phosphate isomerase [Candidatus Chloroheliales bacterium]|nr:MAG: S-methyl-5-thioribose-1-phosphate isomerase [Chloroflexota bacterium]
MRPVWWDDNEAAIGLIDQTRLPLEVRELHCRDYRELAAAIKTMKVRGAPAIGVAAAYGVALAAMQSRAADTAALRRDLERAIADLAETRPTAVNLFWALSRMRQLAARLADSGDMAAMRAGLLAEAKAIEAEDDAACRAMGAHGATLVPATASILTHCNAGGLATTGYGSAVGVIRAAHDAGKGIHVYVGETRPLLQGARLTTWELQQAGIPMTLITDSMAAYFMAQGKVDLVITGADRIAANGDTANKIGTYGLAVLAHAHNIPFYVAAPSSTIDAAILDGSHIPIEQRAASEVTELAGQRIAPPGVAAANPAFDVTPARYITAIITEQGIFKPPFDFSRASPTQPPPMGEE